VALVPGVRLGHYEIISPLGAGGMGEVTAPRHWLTAGRVKVPLAHLAHNPSPAPLRGGRLPPDSHPNICAFFRRHRQDGHSYLVMEYLEGQTVAERLRSGPLAVPEALRVAIDSACGLATAHQCGVVHRDLKPANVMLTRTGVKLLDFGLARDIATAVAGMSSCEEEDTVDRQLTGQGAIVGTFHYLSPEQLLGRDADVRSDVFAFGALCYEMVTGRRAFEGDKPASIIAAVLERAPEPPRSIRSEVPASLQATIQRCLEKDPDRRWHCVADLIQELRRIEQCPGDRRRQRTTEPQPRERSAGRTAAYWFAAGALLASIAGWQLARPRAPVPVVHSSIVTPEGARFAFTGDEGGPVVLAPNQQSLAFVASLEGGEHKLFVQHLASGLATPLAGTEDATFPFWSPDGRTLAFFTGGRLRRIDVAGGGPPVDVCRVGLSARGGSWGANGTIILSPDWNEGIYRVDASGGEPVAVTRVDRASQTTHRWPVLLPDGRHFITWPRTTMRAASSTPCTSRASTARSTNASCAPTGARRSRAASSCTRTAASSSRARSTRCPVSSRVQRSSSRRTWSGTSEPGAPPSRRTARCSLTRAAPRPAAGASLSGSIEQVIRWARWATAACSSPCDSRRTRGSRSPRLPATDPARTYGSPT
jgi:serine/threonine protein kinase